MSCIFSPAFHGPAFSSPPLTALLVLSKLSVRIMSVAAATHIGVRYSLVICQVAIMTDRRDR